MRVDKELSKGSHELIILKLLSREDMYGYQIIQQMALLSENAFNMSQGSLYPFLHRLECDGLLTSYSVQENGRERVFYHLTAQGRLALQSKEEKWQEYVRVMERILKGGEKCAGLGK